MSHRNFCAAEPLIRCSAAFSIYREILMWDDPPSRRDKFGEPLFMDKPVCHALEALYDNGSHGRIPFHMPGHKRKYSGFFKDTVLYDITEITGYDNLHDPSGIIRKSMDCLREIYGTEESWYLVGGSTLGILAAISSVCRIHDTVLVGRNCHKSVYNAIRLLHLHPLYVYPDFDDFHNLAAGISVDAIQSAFRENKDIKACIITSPTYEGVVSDVASIHKLCEACGIPLIVDEAHGAHFIFHEYFPKSAIECGADLVVQSTHKTLPSMTQTALLHLCSKRIKKEKVQDYISIYETSSPSYILMASCEYGVISAYEKVEKVEKYVDNLKCFRKKCGQLKNIELLSADHPKFYDYDRGKLVFYTAFGGKDLFDRLRDLYDIELEMADRFHVIAMTSFNDEEDDFDRLYRALEEIDRFYGTNRKEDHGRQEVQTVYGRKNFTLSLGKRPKKIYESWECQDQDMEYIIPDRALGRISFKYVNLYPPGIPLLVPGELISENMIHLIKDYLDHGYGIQGISDGMIAVMV